MGLDFKPSMTSLNMTKNLEIGEFKIKWNANYITQI